MPPRVPLCLMCLFGPLWRVGASQHGHQTNLRYQIWFQPDSDSGVQPDAMCLRTDSRSLYGVDCGPGEPVCAQLLHCHCWCQGFPGLFCKLGTCDLHHVVVIRRDVLRHKYGKSDDLRADRKNYISSQIFRFGRWFIALKQRH